MLELKNFYLIFAVLFRKAGNYVKSLSDYRKAADGG